MVYLHRKHRVVLHGEDQHSSAATFEEMELIQMSEALVSLMNI